MGVQALDSVKSKLDIWQSQQLILAVKWVRFMENIHFCYHEPIILDLGWLMTGADWHHLAKSFCLFFNCLFYGRCSLVNFEMQVKVSTFCIHFHISPMSTHVPLILLVSIFFPIFLFLAFLSFWPAFQVICKIICNLETFFSVHSRWSLEALSVGRTSLPTGLVVREIEFGV